MPASGTVQTVMARTTTCGPGPFMTLAVRKASNLCLATMLVMACASGSALGNGAPLLPSSKLTFSVPPAVTGGARVSVTGKVAHEPHGAKVVFQWLRRTKWVSLGRANLAHGRFKLSVLVPAGPSVLRVRAIIVVGRSRVAVSRVRELRVRMPGRGVKAVGPTTVGPRAAVSNPATPSTPGPSGPTSPGSIAVTAPPVTVAVGSIVEIPAPAPITSLTELDGSIQGTEPGVAVTIAGGGLAVSAAATATTASMTLTITGTACTSSECGRQFVMQLPVTVKPIAAPAGPIETFTQPSPDRIAEAVNNELQDEILIMLGTSEQPGTREQADAAAGAVGAVVSGGISEDGIFQIRWSTPQDLSTRIAELESQPHVTSVSPSIVGLTETQTAYAPIVAPAYDQPYWTWRYDQVHAREAWAHTTGSDVTVGLVDVGDAFAGSPNLNVSNTLDPIAVPGAHATNVAGLACGKPYGSGMVGMAWGCPIVTTYADATGTDIPDASVMAAMQRVVKIPGVRVINTSMGAGSGCATQTYRDSIEQWIAHSQMFFRRILQGAGSDIVWTFSAGNNCMSGPSSPWAANSDLPNVIDVAASNADGRLASFSNYGMAVAAPGGVEPTEPAIDLHASCDSDDALDEGRCGLLSSTVGPCSIGYCAERGEMSGTSMAAPMVAGIAALVTAQHPSFDAAQIAACITSTAGTEGVGSTGAPDGQPGGIYANPPLPYTGAPIPIVNAAAAVACETPVPTEQATPMGPTSGPAGFGMQVSLPSCTYLDVSFDGTQGYVQSEYSPTTTFDLVTTSGLADGQHQMSFACESSVGGTVLWRSPGFSITITGGPIALGLQSTTAAPGEAIVYTSGPSESTTTCPSLPGVALYGLSIYLDTPTGLAVTASRFIAMPDEATTEALTVPPETPAGEYTALERCYYSGTNQLGIFEFTGPYHNVTVTNGASSAVKKANTGAASRRVSNTTTTLPKATPDAGVSTSVTTTLQTGTATAFHRTLLESQVGAPWFGLRQGPG